MQLVVRKLGNSMGVTFPAALVKDLGIKLGQALDAANKDGVLVLTPPARPRYALADLVAQCDPTAPMPADLVAWDRASAVGREAW